MKGRIVFEVMDGPVRRETFAFQEHDTFLFARSKDCHARPPEKDASVSRHHFVVEVHPPAALLRDLGSRNGTFVNGVR